MILNIDHQELTAIRNLIEIASLWGDFLDDTDQKDAVKLVDETIITVQTVLNRELTK